MFLLILASIFFSLIVVLLLTAILLQPARPEMGGTTKTGQMLFGGAGGRELVENVTWIFVFLFMASALGLSILKTREASRTKLETVEISKEDEKSRKLKVDIAGDEGSEAEKKEGGVSEISTVSTEELSSREAGTHEENDVPEGDAAGEDGEK